MKPSFYLLAFFTCFLFGMGAMFEFLIWPGRGIIVASGFLMLNFGLMPMFFYQKYKASQK